MAATGYTPISLYYSTTASTAPTSGNLVNGELAINITDGKLYYKDNAGVVQVIAGKGGAGVAGGSNTQVQYNSSGSLAGSASLTWDGTYLTAGSIKDSALTSGRVTYAGASGVLQDSVNMTFNGTTLTVNTLNLTNALTTTYGGTGLTTFTAGDLPYYATGTALSKLGIGAPGYVLTSSGTAPQWTQLSTIGVTSITGTASQIIASASTGAVTLSLPSTINVNTSGTAANVTGTVAIANGGTGQTTASAAFNALSPITTTGDLIIGTGVNTAGRLGIGTNGQVLQSNGTTASWVTFTGGATITPTTTNTTYYLVGTSSTSGTFSTASISTTIPISYNPSTGDLKAAQVVASNGLLENSNTISASYTIATGNNAVSVGPVTVASGQTVTVSSGQRWVVL
jgi:hypothetical protein